MEGTAKLTAQNAGTQTLDHDYLDDYNREDDSGWYAMQWHVYDQWLSYDFGMVTPVGQLCLRWDDFKNITYGATSVRIDTSTDGTTWVDGATYTSSNSGLEPGDQPNPYSTRRIASAYAAGQPLENVTLDDLCFNIEEISRPGRTGARFTRTTVATRTRTGRTGAHGQRSPQDKTNKHRGRNGPGARRSTPRARDGRLHPQRPGRHGRVRGRRLNPLPHSYPV